jgi:rubrerythrin
MPEFISPFSGTVPEHKLTKEELIRAIRLNIAAEHEAVHLYTSHADATDHPLARRVLLDIANEEREHIGEFIELLQMLTGDEDAWTAAGRKEVEELASELDAVGQSGVTGPESDGGPEFTVGQLRE